VPLFTYPVLVPADPDLVVNYLAWCQLESATQGEQLLAGAWDRAVDLAREWPEDAWSLAEAVLQRTQDYDVAMQVGINILEDLMRAHASQFIDRLEASVHRDSLWAIAVGSMWNRADPVQDRFRALVGLARMETARLRADL
jgi:hypothetical protein